MNEKSIPGTGARKSTRSPTDIDLRIGQLIRERRTARGLRLEDLAASLGLATHQLQKYETGSNRVPASRLVECARILGVPVAWFFSEIGKPTTELSEVPEEQVLVELFRGLDETGRAQLIRIAKVLSGSQATGD